MSGLSWDQMGHHLSASLDRLSEAVEHVEQSLGDLQRSTASMSTQVQNLQAENNDLRKKVQEISEHVAVLNFKSGMWGAGAGAAATLLSLMVKGIK